MDRVIEGATPDTPKPLPHDPPGELEPSGALAGAPRGRGIRRVVVSLVGVLGILVTLGFVAHFGLGVIGSTLSTLGWPGFAAFCVYTLGVFMLLGCAWFVLGAGLSARQYPAFVWGRLMREAAADVLPFSQLGGFVIGARAASLLGAPSTLAVASSLVDLSTEIVGQLLFTGLGVAMAVQLVHGAAAHRLVDPMFTVGFALALATAVGFIFTQRAGLGLLTRLGARFAKGMVGHLASVHGEIERIYRRPGRLGASVMLHLLAWIGATGGVWMVLGFMHAQVSLRAVIAMESLIYLVRSAAFVVPGAIGILEGGYVLVGPVFGVPAEVALSLSLIKRARDFALGGPAVLAWQLLESGRWMKRRV